MPVEIRPATKEDLPGAIGVNVQTLPEHYIEKFWSDTLATFPALFYVAKDGDNVVGYIMGNLFQTLHQGRLITAANVASVAVLSSYRNRGIATSLLNEFYRGAKSLGLTFAALQVRFSNVNAKQLYDHQGFETIHTIPNYYSNGESAYLMLRLLQ